MITSSSPIESATRFPEPGELVLLAYRDLKVAATGDEEQLRLLGAVDKLPRPWNPASCTNPRLQEELWHWLHRVAEWVNRELCWQPADIVPNCWRQHPRLVRELALLADRRWSAEAALTSDPVEEWHRSTLPAFLAEVRADGAGCVTGHRDWPGRARHARRAEPRPADDPT